MTFSRCWSLFLFAALLLTPAVRAEVDLPNDAPECVRWASRDLQDALQTRELSSARIVVSIERTLPAEGFELNAADGSLLVRGADANGCMYGIFETAERISSSVAGWKEFLSTFKPVRQQPYIQFRADNSFCHLHPFLFNDVEMWRRYIDMLARNRFNALDLHGSYDLDETEFPNLFPMLVHVREYDDVGNADEQARNLADFKRIVQHAKARGITVALMNYDAEVKGLDKRHWQDYTARAVAALLREVPELTMIGFRVGESGKNADFYREAYVRGVELSGRTDVRVYTRSWKANSEKLAAIGNDFPGRYDIEIKFNGEQLGLPYHAMHGTHENRAYASYSYQDYIRANAPYGIIWQVRANGTHRFFAWADSEFIRRTVQTLHFGNARGFSLEPHTAYFSTRMKDYYRARDDQQVYDYIWEKHWAWYLAWGRLAYDPGVSDDVLKRHCVERYGESGGAIYDAMQASGNIVPDIMAYRFQGPDHRHFSPETETGCPDESDPERAFMHHEPMDSRNFARISEFVDERIKGAPDGRVGPQQISARLRTAARKTRELVAEADAKAQRHPDQWRLLKTDLLAAAALGDYYASRIDGSLHLCYALKTGSKMDFEKANALFDQSRAEWKQLAGIADPIFAPLNNPLRAQRKFRWGRALKDLEDQDHSVYAKLWNDRKPDPRALPLGEAASAASKVPAVTSVHCRLAPTHATITVKLEAPASAVRVWYKALPSDEKWAPLEMQHEANGYVAEVPLDDRGLLYQIEVRSGDAAAQVPNVLKTRPYWIIDPCSGERPASERDEVLER